MDLNKKPLKEKSVFSEIFLDKEARLSKKSFHYKLLKFYLGEDRIPKYNFCPYFWLVVFFIVISTFTWPITLAYLVLKFIISLLIDGFGYLLENLSMIYETEYVKPINESRARKLEECSEDIFMGWINYNDALWKRSDNYEKFYLTDEEYQMKFYPLSRKEREALSAKFKLWREHTPDWKDKLETWKQRRIDEFNKRKEYYKQLEEELRTARIKREASETERKAKAAKKQAQIKNFMIKAAKWMSVLLLIPLYYIALGLYYVGKWIFIGAKTIVIALIDFFTSLTSAQWLNTLVVILYIVAAVMIIFGLIYLVRFIINWIKEKEIFGSTSCEPVKDSGYLNFMYTLSKIILWLPSKIIFIFYSILLGIIEGVKFFVIFFKNWKSDNCPEIIWEEDENE